MRHSEVLVITENTTTPTILNWKVSTVSSVDSAIEKVQLRPYKVVAIANTFKDAEKAKLRQIVQILDEKLIVVEYTDESSLTLNVKTAYFANKKLNSKSNYLDNSFELKLATSLQSN